MKLIKKLFYKYIGKVEYIVNVVSVDGKIEISHFEKLKDVDNFVNEINKINYWMVEKIEKTRKCEFEYNKHVLHKPLWFSLKNKTELHNNFSYLIKHKSLTSVKRENLY